MKNWIEELIRQNVGKVEPDEPLARHTTWRIGGPADAWIEVKNQEGMRKTLEILNLYEIPWKVLGKGSNLLVSDKGFRGAILSIENAYKSISIRHTTIRVGAGFSMIRMANLAAKHGLTGLEFAGGIPGTVGGAVYMNAGAHGSDISNILVEADLILPNGDFTIWKKADFQFRYRSSNLQKTSGILLAVEFRLEEGERKKIAEKMAAFKDRRRKTQPYQLPCAGSVFRNPEGNFAGKLIEELGLKGFRIGDAQISAIHANFIVNLGHATAKDVLAVMEHVQEKIYQAYHIEMVPEVELFGER